MMFWHPGIETWSRLVDGFVSPHREQALRKHLEKCSACQKQAHALGHVKMIFGNLPALEESVIEQPHLPAVLPQSPAHFLNVIFGIVGVAFFFGSFVIMHRPQPVLKVISSEPEVFSSDGAVGQSVSANSSVRTFSEGHVDLEIPGQVLIRLKPGAIMTWQQIHRPWLFEKPHIVVNLMRGELLARTKEAFWGSQLDVRTPTATTAIHGTAFSLKADPSRDETTLQVLAGEIFFSPYLKQVGVKVEAGQTSRIQGNRLPDRPKALSPMEKEALLETYQIGEEPFVALVIGGGPERVEEFLNPALLYVSQKDHPQLQPLIRKIIKKLNSALLAGAPGDSTEDLKLLDLATEYLSDVDLAIPLKLYLGAYAAHQGDSVKALTHFRSVAEHFPDHPLAPLALAAAGVVSAGQLNGRISSEQFFQQIISRYPQSPEALYARRFLKEKS